MAVASFEFAFDNPAFSDRLLRVEITKCAPCQVDIVEVQAGAAEEPVQKSSVQTETIHVSSVILAAHSEYFKTLFSNGMCESNSSVATVQVTEEEKCGLRELIHYMYTGRLNQPSDAEGTIVLLTLADRFAVSSCMELLANVLKKFPSTLSDSLLVLSLPELLKADRAVQPVVEHYRSYLAHQFSDIYNKKNDFLTLNVQGVKVVLDSDSLSVSYEEEVFKIMLEWLDANYHTTEEKNRAAEEICEVVRFPWMTGDFLVDVVSVSPQMQSPACQAFIMEAFRFKSFTHSRQQQMLWKKTNHNRYSPRSTVILESLWGNSKTFAVGQNGQSCEVFFEFPLELVICTGQHFQSRPFQLGEYSFYLEARHGQVKASYNQQMTLIVNLVVPPSCSWKFDAHGHHSSLDYSIAMKRDYSQGYQLKESGNLDLQVAEVAGTCYTFKDLFPDGWFIERGFTYPRWNLSISGPVFLRLDLRLKPEDGNLREVIEKIGYPDTSADVKKLRN